MIWCDNEIFFLKNIPFLIALTWIVNKPKNSNVSFKQVKFPITENIMKIDPITNEKIFIIGKFFEE